MPTDGAIDDAADIPAGRPSPLEPRTDPLAVANTFIHRFSDGVGIQHMKLQKLAYYTHAWWLSRFDTPYLTRRPEVWRFGPVFSGLYSALRGYGSRPIVTPQPSDFADEPPIIDGGDEQIVSNLIDWVWGRYGGLTAEQLSERTHAKGTPWQIIAERHNYTVPRYHEIDDNTIKRCFRKDRAEVLRAQ
jgi:uncharacterized phage-associated protein